MSSGIAEWLNTHFLNLWPAGVGLAVTVPLVVLLYFLKLRRKENVVSSTLLWQRALEDMRVNAPFQRLKANLLLLLQLLILLAICAALARPFLQGSEGGRKSGLVILVDNSASMSTRDCGSRTRLEAARKAALEEVQNLGSDVQAAVIAFGTRPQVLTGFTSSRQELTECLEKIRVSGGGTDLSAALKVADGMAGSLSRDSGGASGRDRCRLLVFSDAALPPDEPVSPVASKDIQLRWFGAGSDNTAITSLEARRSPGSGAQVFVRVLNAGSEKVERELRLFIGDQSRAVDVKTVELEGGQTRTVIFESSAPRKMAVARAELSGGDLMPVDDTAWAVIPPESRLKVLAYTADQYFLDKVLRSLPRELCAFQRQSVDSLPADGDKAGRIWQEYDAVIFDRVVPAFELPPSGGFMFMGPEQAPGIGDAQLGKVVEAPRIVDWDRAHQLLRFTSLSGLLIGKARPVNLGPGQVDVLEAREGVLIAAWQRDQLRAVVVGFDIYESNWPLRLSFPLFMANSVRWLSEASPKWAGAGLSCGQPLKLQAGLWTRAGVKGNVPVTLLRPDGNEEKFELAPDRPRMYAATGVPGIYRVKGPEDLEAVYACAVLSERESRNAARKNINFAVGDVRGASWALSGNEGENENSGREIWKYIAALALAVMVLEWYIYNRRLWG